MNTPETKPVIAHVEIIAKTYYDYACGVEIVGQSPSPEQLQTIADDVFRLADGTFYDADEQSWDLVEAVAEIRKVPKKQIHYKATWNGEEFDVEEL